MRNNYLLRGCMAALLAFGALSISPAHAGLFGESDEEKAARQHEKDQDASIADLNQRLHDLEQSLSRATGDNESLSHQVQVLSDKLERQKKDFEYRLCTIAAQQLGAGQGDDQAALPCAGGGGVSTNYNAAPPPQPQMQQQSSGTVRLAPPPSVLGTLPAGARMVSAAPAPNSSSKAQFDAALNMLAKARYDDARAAFRAYADSNPGDELTPQAVYWIGDIAYVQKDYPEAARAFAEQIKKYPTSSRGPDSMLKLGQSLIAMGQTKEGCMTLGALPSKYSAASKSVVAQAAAERKTACH